MEFKVEYVQNNEADEKFIRDSFVYLDGNYSFVFFRPVTFNNIQNE
jgi:hypothetical protein